MKTPFGEINTELNLFPIYYILILYSIGIFFPTKIFADRSLFYLWSGEEYLAEYFQFVFYLLSSFFSFLIFLKKDKKLIFKKICWFLLFLLFIFVSFEEISHLDLIEINYIKKINDQNLTNIHNLQYFQPHLKKFFILINLTFGWFGWRNFSNIEFLPSKKYCLYFLFCATIYSLEELKNFTSQTNFSLIPFPQEAGEFLMAMGLFLYTFDLYRSFYK